MAYTIDKVNPTLYNLGNPPDKIFRSIPAGSSAITHASVRRYEKMIQVWRAGRDIGEVLQRYISTLTIHDEKIQ